MILNDQPQWDLFNDYHENPEYNLFDSLINEFSDIAGFPIYYWIKTNIEEADWLYGEDQNETFDGTYQTKIVYEPTEETEVLNSFGLSSDDTLQYIQIAKTKFSEDIAENYGDSNYVPKPGDVIQLMWNGKTYNIVDTGAEQKIFQAKKLVWELICRPYAYSEESESADDILFSEPPSADFSEDNTTIETEPTSAYGDNKEIEDEKSDVNPDSLVYGYE